VSETGDSDKICIAGMGDSLMLQTLLKSASDKNTKDKRTLHPQPSHPHSSNQVQKSDELNPRARVIRAMFSSIAPSYDFLNHFLSLSVDHLWRRRVVRTALSASSSGNSPVSILDVCTGTGDLAFAFARRCRPDDVVVGLDFSHPMLCLALQKQRKKNNPRWARKLFSEGDALRLPFCDNTFDVASVAFGLRNFVDRPAGVREMARVVRPGGLVLILEFSQMRCFGLRNLYAFYLNRILPWMGNRLSGSRAYSYLADTVGRFPEPPEVMQWMELAGLAGVCHRRLSGGIAVLYQGSVPE